MFCCIGGAAVRYKVVVLLKEIVAGDIIIP